MLPRPVQHLLVLVGVIGVCALVALGLKLCAGLLEGVTRNFVFEIAKVAGIPVSETVLRAEDLPSADEMFLTSTTREILPVTRLDDHVVGTGAAGPITRALASAFHKQARTLSGL